MATTLLEHYGKVAVGGTDAAIKLKSLQFWPSGDNAGVEDLAAAGNAQGNAAAITKTVTYVTGADGTKGVVLPASNGDSRILFVINSDTTNDLKIYPASGEKINEGSANAAITINEKSLAVFIGQGTEANAYSCQYDTAAGAAYTQTYSTADRTHANLTAADLTDNSTGSASTTIAAGVGVYDLPLYAVLPIGGTSAVDQVTTFTPGHKFKILAWSYLESVATTGTNSSRVYNMEIGTTDVGTSPSTLTVTTSGAAVGRVIAGTAVSGANTGTSSDTISIEVAASGTTHDAGAGMFIIRIQNMDTADAIASLAAQTDALLVDLTDAKQMINANTDDLQAAGLAG